MQNMLQHQGSSLYLLLNAFCQFPHELVHFVMMASICRKEACICFIASYGCIAQLRPLMVTRRMYTSSFIWHSVIIWARSEGKSGSRLIHSAIRSTSQPAFNCLLLLYKASLAYKIGYTIRNVFLNCHININHKMINKTCFYLSPVLLACYQLYFHPDEDGCILELIMVEHLWYLLSESGQSQRGWLSELTVSRS